MTDSTLPPEATPPSNQPRHPQTAVRAIRFVLYLALASAIGAVALAGYQFAKDKSAMKNSGDRLVDRIGLTPLSIRHLAPNYADKDGRLVADPPSNPNQLLDPDTLVLAYDEDPDAESQLVDWMEFEKHLAQVTGKKVTSQEYRNNVEDVAAVAEGKIQVVALHAADTPFLVNNAGFIPVAVLSGETGANGNRLAIAVPAASKIQNMSDLLGHTLTCATPISITGYRAAVAVLQEETGMRPEVDYFISFSLSQKRSVLGLADGEFEAAALSADKLQSLLKKGKIKQSDYRVIYQSQVIPRLTIGSVYNLQPELAAKVRQAVLDFKNEGGAEEETSGKPMRFVAVDYKKDFDFVRKIDGSFDPRLGAKAAKSKAAAPAAGSSEKD